MSLFGSTPGINRMFDSLGYCNFNANPLASAPAGITWQAAAGSDTEADAVKMVLNGAVPYATARLSLSSIVLGNATLSGKETYLQCSVKAVAATGQCAIAVEYTSAKAGPGTRTSGLPVPTGTYSYETHSWKLQLFDDAVITGILLLMPGSASTGTVYIKSIQFNSARHMQELPAINEGYSGETLIRGFNIDNEMNGSSYMNHIAAVYKPNLVRYGMALPSGSPNYTDVTAYHAWFLTEIAQLDQALQYAALLGIKVVIDMHSPPGGPDTPLRYLSQLETSPNYWDEYLSNWTYMATRYKDHPAVYGYEVQNEPGYAWDAPQHAINDPNCWDMTDSAIKRIRAIDAVKPIIVTADYYSYPSSFVGLKPWPYANLIYTVHYYGPSEFYATTNWAGGAPVSYPGYSTGPKSVWPSGSYQTWTAGKEYLRKYLQPARDFQQRYEVPILVGEFADYKYAPGAAAKMADQISIFEEWGWDWIFFGQAGINKTGNFGWADVNLELANDKSITGSVGATTDRAQLFISAFSANRSLFAPQLPSPPIIAISEPSSTTAVVTWVAAPSPTTYFEVSYKLTSGSTWTDIVVSDVLSTSYLIQGMVPGSSYDYRVKALNTQGSAVSSVYTAVKQVITALSLVSASALASVAEAYSTRKVYSGATIAFRVRRSSDNAQQDIGFVGEDLDTASLLAFCGAGDGFIVTWVGQKNGKNATHATAATQPKIVSSGALVLDNARPSINFSGANYLGYAGLLGLATALGTTLVGIGKNIAATGTNWVAGESNSSVNVQRFGYIAGAFRTTEVKMWAKDDANVTMLDPNGSSQVSGFTVGLVRQFVSWYDGANAKTASNITPTLTQDVAKVAGGAPTLNQFTIGGSANLGKINANFQELLLFTSALSVSDLAALRSSQASYYSLV